MNSPAWLILAWCGAAATFTAAVAGAVAGGRKVGSWSLGPLPYTRTEAFTWSVAAGLGVYPLAYGILFELVHQADLKVGAIAGILHAGGAFAYTIRQGTAREAAGVAVATLAYGLMLAFLYITP